MDLRGGGRLGPRSTRACQAARRGSGCPGGARTLPARTLLRLQRGRTAERCSFRQLQQLVAQCSAGTQLMASITIWNRVEPRARSQDMKSGLEARVHDPLWLLTRQWQVGEFAGRDAGSPVMVEVKSTATIFDRYTTG